MTNLSSDVLHFTPLPLRVVGFALLEILRRSGFNLHLPEWLLAGYDVLKHTSGVRLCMMSHSMHRWQRTRPSAQTHALQMEKSSSPARETQVEEMRFCWKTHTWHPDVCWRKVEWNVNSHKNNGSVDVTGRSRQQKGRHWYWESKRIQVNDLVWISQCVLEGNKRSIKH